MTSNNSLILNCELESGLNGELAQSHTEMRCLSSCNHATQGAVQAAEFFGFRDN